MIVFIGCLGDFEDIGFCDEGMNIYEGKKGGGTGHRNASAADAEGFLAIKYSEDSCATDGKGNEKLKVFSETKVPTMVPLKPEDS